MRNKKELANIGKEGTEKLDKDKLDKKEIEEENLVLHLHHLLCLARALLRIAKVLGVDFDVNNF